MKTNFLKKLFYIIEKTYSVFVKIFKKANESFEKTFISLLKKILFRGSNYFKHDQLYLLNNIINNENLYELFFDYLRN